MDETLKALYDSFYTPPEMAELKRAVEANRVILRDKLPVEQRKLVLRIVDDLNMMAFDLSMDSFICGFKLAWQMANELNSYDDRRSTPAKQAGLSACSVSRERDEI
ncbi:MAG: hypothetical protein VB094_03485 [Oscillibacter sp.]|nr:hypothetical protein [Oscillibacter sp.]